MNNAMWGGVFFIAISLWLLKKSFVAFSKFETSRKWPNVNGIITSSEVFFIDVPRHYDLLVEYEYVVKGKEFSGNSVALYTLTRSEAKLLNDKYESNPEVEVFYNPKSPSESLLITGSRKDKPYSDMVMATIGLLVGILIFIGGYYGIFNNA